MVIALAGAESVLGSAAVSGDPQTEQRSPLERFIAPQAGQACIRL